MQQRFTHRQKEFKKAYMIIDHDKHMVQMLHELPKSEQKKQYLMVTTEIFYTLQDDCINSDYVMTSTLV